MIPLLLAGAVAVSTWDGVLYEGATLDEVWPRAKPYGDYPWLLEGTKEIDDRPIAGR